ncbi:DUF2958 domain-containing protein [Microvirga tunisiensis]|uniref:DUF2958 domain-containing protein n=1 Tax=Microvirga tunisiensis TaxID=2108360 RepID=A0A5N7MDB4_9HYPH|nr:DUF2958 domain-containing protein [Microvirga tunisiensis]MPR06308.1 DUF2958 domain-containing protein [Microvirga tunisiensis]MPR24094.1 DUF2958 domain-containing protein [Microvirga tunisiensis]
MDLIPEDLRQVLIANGQASQDGTKSDHIPVVKLFMPDSQATWLITELKPSDPDLAYGLADLGMGAPESGWFRLSDIIAQRGVLNLPIKRDPYFRADRPLSAYEAAAIVAGRIVTLPPNK